MGKINLRTGKKKVFKIAGTNLTPQNVSVIAFLKITIKTLDRQTVPSTATL